jgi:hypothetical protein
MLNLGENRGVSVVPFSLAPGAQVLHYDDTPRAAGRAIADNIVRELKDRGVPAVVATDQQPTTPLVVSGRIAQINGGSKTKRAVLGLGAGHATVTIEGEVARPDGQIVATFGDERGSVGRIGFGGGSNEFVVGICVQDIGEDVAEMIATGKYEGGRPIPVPANVPSQPEKRSALTTEDRLRELDKLRREGLVTDDEYESKRREILDAL